MKVITLWQPWASFVELEWKIIEMREHELFKCPEGKEILIHAGKKWDNSWEKLALEKY